MIPFYEHGKPDYFGAHRITVNKRGLHCDAHLHVNIELVLLLKGRTQAFADAEQTVLEGGDVFLSFPNQIHRFISEGPEDYYIFIVNPDYIPEISAVFWGQQPTSACICGAANDTEVLELAARLAELDGQHDRWSELRRRAYLLALFGKLLPQMTLTDTVSGDSQALRTVVSYCTQNFTGELSLGLLERELHISKYYISHLFSDKLHISFNDYVNSLRVSFACRHLRNSSTPVTEIAALAGFGTLRTFNRVFASRMGQTPTAYRRTCRNEKTRRES